MKASPELARWLQTRRVATEGADLPLASPRPQSQSVPPVCLDSLKKPHLKKSPRPATTSSGNIQVVLNRIEDSLGFDDLSHEYMRGDVQKTKAGNMSSRSPRSPGPSSTGRPFVSGIRQFAANQGKGNEVRRGNGPQNMKEFKELSARLAVEEAKSEELQRQLDVCQQHAAEDSNRLRNSLEAAEERNAELAKELEDCKNHLDAANKTNSDLMVENKNLDEQRLQTQQKLESVQKASASDCSTTATTRSQQDAGSSESALRAVMAKPGASVDELRQAIKGVEALLHEAQRELQRGEHRQERAAYEKLYAVLEKVADEEALESAVSEARRVGLNQEDIDKGEARLLQLRSMTDVERAALEAEQIKAKLKSEFFLLVKKNDYVSLEEQVSELGDNIPWEDWRDHNGRTLIAYAKELRLLSVIEVLESLLAEKKPKAREAEASNAKRPCPVVTIVEAATCDHLAEDSISPKKAGLTTPETGTPPSGTESPAVPSSQLSTPEPSITGKMGIPPLSPITSPTRRSSMMSVISNTPATPAFTGEYADIKKAAFRAAGNGDEEGLKAALKDVPTDIWEEWRNKADQDLLEIAKRYDERKGTSGHTLLLNMLGRISERTYEALEEGDSVWVMFTGDVMARRATVKEDTLAEAQKVLLEYWEGDDPPMYVERCCVGRI